MKDKVNRNNVIFILLFFHCNSLANYAIDRTRDFGDTVNLGVEKEIYGFSFHFLGAPIGIQEAASGKGIGLRFGHLGFYDTGDETDVILYPSDDRSNNHYKGYKFGNINIFDFSPEWNSYYHKPTGRVTLRNWKKRFFSYHTARCAKFMIKYKGEESSGCGKFYFQYSGRQIEISIGFYLGIRIGFNINEFLDLVFGLFGFDIQSDDSGTNPELNDILNSPKWEKKDFNELFNNNIIKPKENMEITK